MTDTPAIPHLRIILAVGGIAIAGYLGFSIWTVIYLKDATMVGDVIGTWKSFAVAAFAFWLGSSSGGKAKGSTPSGTPADPVNVVPQDGPQQ